MVRLLAFLGVGYVLGAKAGRRRYDQINVAYRTVTESPATRRVIDVGRQKLSERISPTEPMRRIHPIANGSEHDGATQVYAPRDPRD